VLFALLLLPLRFAHADSGIEKQLNFDYMEKVLTLRHFYIGEHLRFHSDGTLRAAGYRGQTDSPGFRLSTEATRRVNDH
jgi:hypothetical protein